MKLKFGGGLSPFCGSSFEKSMLRLLSLGGVPVYMFLKEALIRKYGEEFYEALEASAEQLKKG